MDLSIIIIGAGSTGLLLAQGLKQKQIHATVYEREEPTTYRDRPREWGMTMHWGSSFVATCIPPDLQATLDEKISCDPSYTGKNLSLPHFNGETGQKLFETPGHEPKRISRKKLRNFLSQGIKIEYGKRLESIQKTDSGMVTAQFTDGTSTIASCIIGCDGAHSAVRPHLVGDEASQVNDLDIQMINVCCTLPRELSLRLRNFANPIFKNSYHPTGIMWWLSIQGIEDPDKPETWLWQNLVTWKGSPRPHDLPDQASRLKYWKEIGKKFAEPWCSIAQALPDDLQFGVDKASFWIPVDWSDSQLAGVVTVAGDAAHCMPPHRGQGLNNGMEDAANLVEQLSRVQNGGKSLKTALQDYATEMQGRATTEIHLSVNQAQAAHDLEELMQGPMFKHGMSKYGGGESKTGGNTEEVTSNG